MARFWSVLAVLGLLAASAVHSASLLDGNWEFVSEGSSELPLFTTIALDIAISGNTSVDVSITWSAGAGHADTFSDVFKGLLLEKPNQVAFDCWVFPYNVFQGFWRNISVPVYAIPKFYSFQNELVIDLSYTLEGSQGGLVVHELHVFAATKLDNGTVYLKYSVGRDSRAGDDYRYMFVPKQEHQRRAVPRSRIQRDRRLPPPPPQALPQPIAIATDEPTIYPYVLKLDNDWNQTTGGLGEKLLLLSLQGLANSVPDKTDPQLYFLYSDEWDFTYTPAVYEFYQDYRHCNFTQLSSRYVIYDPTVRVSIMVALTQAGLDRVLVIDPSWESYMTSTFPSLPCVADYRGKFAGMTDLAIYQWAYGQFGSRASRNMTIWLGGVCGAVMQPGIADWGVSQQAFFSDLSTNPADKDEYAFASEIMGKQDPYTMVMGWHSYCKDEEKEFVTLSSSHTLRVEGLNTVPNLSFSHRMTVTPGFAFKNHHSIKTNRHSPNVDTVYPPTPSDKVYIGVVQTDGIGLGAWTKPGRGLMPYAWEVTINDLWMAPAMLEFFYRNATQLDYFVGALGGPGYMYPKPVPKEALPHLLTMAFDMMNALDVDLFEIMDYSEMGYNPQGTNNLPKSVVEVYESVMENITGLINGYAPSYTFGRWTESKGQDAGSGRALLSFDYYLSPDRSEDAAVKDILELAAVNKYVVVPVDVLLSYAGQAPTFRDYYEPESTQ